VTELEIQGAAHHHHGDHGNNDDRQHDIPEQGPVVGGASQFRGQQFVQNVIKGHIRKIRYAQIVSAGSFSCGTPSYKFTIIRFQVFFKEGARRCISKKG
jgi:hypothetical protein